jgi:hypothetical protein
LKSSYFVVAQIWLTHRPEEKNMGVVLFSIGAVTAVALWDALEESAYWRRRGL